MGDHSIAASPPPLSVSQSPIGGGGGLGISGSNAAFTTGDLQASFHAINRQFGVSALGNGIPRLERDDACMLAQEYSHIINMFLEERQQLASPGAAIAATAVAAAAATVSSSEQASPASISGVNSMQPAATFPLFFQGGAGHDGSVGAESSATGIGLAALGGSLPTSYHKLNSRQDSMFSMVSLAHKPSFHIAEHVTRAFDDEGNKMINQYVFIREIGRGSFAKVKLACVNETGEPRAIKILNRSILAKAQQGRALTHVQEEIAIMKKLKHKHLVQLYEVIDDPSNNKIYLVMQFVDKGAVARLDNDGNCATVLPEETARKYLRQVSAGLLYMHQHKCIHHDIKCENILVDRHDDAYLADFGVSEILQDDLDDVDADDVAAQNLERGDGKNHSLETVETGDASSPSNSALSSRHNSGLCVNACVTAAAAAATAVAVEDGTLGGVVPISLPQSPSYANSPFSPNVSHYKSAAVTVNRGAGKRTRGSPAFWAPEICNGACVGNELTDVWALGVSLYCMLFGTLPFKGSNLRALLGAIESEPLQFPPQASFSQRELLSRVLNKDPEKRMTLRALRRHPFLKLSTDPAHVAAEANEPQQEEQRTTSDVQQHQQQAYMSAVPARDDGRAAQQQQQPTGDDDDFHNAAEHHPIRVGLHDIERAISIVIPTPFTAGTSTAGSPFGMLPSSQSQGGMNQTVETLVSRPPAHSTFSTASPIFASPCEFHSVSSVRPPRAQKSADQLVGRSTVTIVENTSLEQDGANRPSFVTSESSGNMVTDLGATLVPPATTDDEHPHHHRHRHGEQQQQQQEEQQEGDDRHILPQTSPSKYPQRFRTSVLEGSTSPQLPPQQHQ